MAAWCRWNVVTAYLRLVVRALEDQIGISGESWYVWVLFFVLTTVEFRVAACTYMGLKLQHGPLPDDAFGGWRGVTRSF